MYNIFLTILLMLPSFGFATPAQPINSLGPITASPGTLNPIGPEPIDPRFSLQPVYQAVPLDEDQCLVAIVQFMGLLGSAAFLEPFETRTYWDDRLPNVEITNRSPRTGGTIEARFLIWGLYLGLKDMIESNRFKNVQFVLRWEGQIVGIIGMKKRAGPRSLLGTNSTDDMQRTSSSNPLNLSASESLNRTSFNLSVPNTPSNPNLALHIEILNLGEPLPKYNVILTLLEGILAVASRTTRARVEDVVQIEAPYPYNARLQVLPEQTAYGQPYLTNGFVALAIRQIPAVLLLQARRWSEVNFRIVVDGVWVARGGITKG